MDIQFTLTKIMGGTFPHWSQTPESNVLSRNAAKTGKREFGNTLCQASTNSVASYQTMHGGQMAQGVAHTADTLNQASPALVGHPALSFSEDMGL